MVKMVENVSRIKMEEMYLVEWEDIPAAGQARQNNESNQNSLNFNISKMLKILLDIYHKILLED